MPLTDWRHVLFEYRRAMGYTPDHVRAMSRRQVLDDLECLALERGVLNAAAHLRALEADGGEG